MKFLSSWVPPASQDSAKALFGWKYTVRQALDWVRQTHQQHDLPHTMYFLTPHQAPVALPPENVGVREETPYVGSFPHTDVLSDPLYLMEGVVSPVTGRVYSYRVVETITPEERKREQDTPVEQRLYHRTEESSHPERTVHKIDPYRARIVSVVPPGASSDTKPMEFLEGEAGWKREGKYTFSAHNVFGSRSRQYWTQDIFLSSNPPVHQVFMDVNALFH